MKKITFIALFLIIPLSAFCQNSGEKKINVTDLPDLRISESEVRYSRVNQFVPVGDHYVTIFTRFFSSESSIGSSSPRLTVLDGNGREIAELGRSGRGPFEWTGPEFIQKSEDSIIIWDGGNRKFLVFDTNYQGKEEILGGIKSNIRKFQFDDDGEIVAAINEVPGRQEFIEIYERDEDGRLAHRQNIGDISGGARILFFVAGTGGVLWNGDDIVYCDPAVPELKVYDTAEDRYSSFPFEDSDFDVDEWDDSINMNSGKAFEHIKNFINENGRIVSLHKIADHILVEVEGKGSGEPLLTYHFFNLEYNYVGQVEMGDGGWANYIWGSGDDKLFYWGEDVNRTGKTGTISVKEVSIR